MELIIKSQKLERKFTFWKSSGGNHYIYECSYQPGTLGRQLCRGGAYSGDTLSATDDSFERTCRTWLKQYVRKNDNN